jgi:peroxiredoxin
MRGLPLVGLVLALAACEADAPADAPAAAPEVASEAAVSPEPGRTAPPFTLTSADGEAVRLADFAGPTVVLEWLNYDCPFVGKHYDGREMQARQAEAAADSVVWLSVVSPAPGEQGHVEPAEMRARTEAEGGRQQAVLLDPSGQVGRAYGALTTPHMFVIGPDGRVAYNGAIDDQPSTDPATLAGARRYVPGALAAVAAGRPPETARTQPYGCSVKYADA